MFLPRYKNSIAVDLLSFASLCQLWAAPHGKDRPNTSPYHRKHASLTATRPFPQFTARTDGYWQPWDITLPFALYSLTGLSYTAIESSSNLLDEDNIIGTEHYAVHLLRCAPESQLQQRTLHGTLSTHIQYCIAHKHGLGHRFRCKNYAPFYEYLPSE